MTSTPPPVSAPRIALARSESPAARFLRRFLRQRLAVAATVFLVVVVVCAVFAPAIAPADPLAQSLRDSLRGPSGDYLLGTDRLGRDTLSRVIFGARFSLLAAVQAVLVASVLGVPVAVVAGLARGWMDTACSMVADAVLSIPAIVLALAIVGVLGPNLTNAMLAIGLVYAPRLFRVVRAATISVREEAFIDAARVSGMPMLTIARTHVVPNVLSPLVVQVSLALGFAVLAEAAISFLGLGVQPPDASWGVMLAEATGVMRDHPELAMVPGLAIVATVLALNAIGDGINDSLGQEARCG